MATVALNTDSEEKRRIKEKTSKPMLWIGMVSIVMVFAGLTSAVIVRQAEGGWIDLKMPFLFWVSTAVIIISSITMNQAVVSAKKDRVKQIKIWTLTTFALGIAFCILQFEAWGVLHDGGVYFTGAASSVSGSYLYVLSGLHLAHLFFGLVSLMVVSFKATKKKYNSKNLLGLQMSAIYWHFLDGLWIYLFLFLNYFA